MSWFSWFLNFEYTLRLGVNQDLLKANVKRELQICMFFVVKASEIKCLPKTQHDGLVHAYEITKQW